MKETKELTHAGASHAALEAKEEKMELATTGKTVKVANLNLVRRLHALIGKVMPGSTGRWSRNQIARALACNTAYVSGYLAQVDDKGRAAANPPELTMSLAAFEDGIEHFLAQIAERKTARDDLFETPISRQFNGFAAEVISARQWGVFHGPGGDGKTCAMQAFARRNPLAIFVTAYKWCCGAGALGQAVFAVVNRAGAWKKNEPAIPWVVERLKGTERVLLVDNFHQLTLGAMTWLGNLQDATGIPIICAGNPSGLTRARQDEQLSTRIKQAKGTEWGEGRQLHNNLKEAAERLLRRDAPDHEGELMPLALTVMRHRGTMRALQARVAKMNSYMEKTDGKVDAPTAFRAAHEALISDGYRLDG